MSYNVVYKEIKGKDFYLSNMNKNTLDKHLSEKIVEAESRLELMQPVKKKGQADVKLSKEFKKQQKELDDMFKKEEDKVKVKLEDFKTTNIVESNGIYLVNKLKYAIKYINKDVCEKIAKEAKLKVKEIDPNKS